jgi:CII-binding regulator of phage lambda lysogenization HflD
MLWHQSGGSRWKLLLGRKQLLAETERLLKHV